MVGIGGKDRDAVARADEKLLSEDHVAVPVAVGGGTKVGGGGTVHDLHQLFRVRQVRVRMATPEITERRAVDHRARRSFEALLEDLVGIGTGDRVHGVVAHIEHTRGEQCTDTVEIEQLLHQGGVVRHGVDDIDLHRREESLPGFRQRNIRCLYNAVVANNARVMVDLVGDLLRRRPAIGGVELDAEIAVGPAWIVARRYGIYG